MFDGRLKVTICGAKDLQHTKLTERFDEWQLTKAKTKEVTSLEPYVAIDVDEVAVERTSTKQKTKARKEDGGRRPAVAHPVLCDPYQQHKLRDLHHLPLDGDNTYRETK